VSGVHRRDPSISSWLCVLHPENLWGGDQINDRIRDVIRIMGALKHTDLPGLYPIVQTVITSADPRLSSAESSGDSNLYTKIPAIARCQGKLLRPRRPEGHSRFRPATGPARF